MSNLNHIKFPGFTNLKNIHPINSLSLKWITPLDKATPVIHGECENCKEGFCLLPYEGNNGLVFVNGRTYDKCPQCSGEPYYGVAAVNVYRKSRGEPLLV